MTPTAGDARQAQGFAKRFAATSSGSGCYLWVWPISFCSFASFRCVATILVATNKSNEKVGIVHRGSVAFAFSLNDATANSIVVSTSPAHELTQKHCIS